LKHDLKSAEPNLSLRAFYKRLLTLRKTWQLGQPAETEITVLESWEALLLLRQPSAGALALLFHFGAQPVEITTQIVRGAWRVLLDSHAFPDHESTSRFSVPFTVHPKSFVVLESISSNPEK
jgi:hypothetical protein